MAIRRLNRRYRECETLGVLLKDMKPPKGGNNHPGPAFWLVLLIIGGAAVLQKVSGPTGPFAGVEAVTSEEAR